MVAVAVAVAVVVAVVVGVAVAVGVGVVVVVAVGVGVGVVVGVVVVVVVVVMSYYRELLIGCGHARDKRIVAPNTTPEWRNLVTLDCNPAVDPTVICDLERFPWPTRSYTFGESRILESSVDEVHAYEVLEHLGQQGDAGAFFDVFSEIYRILKPDGFLCATVPSRFSPWLWGDPSHRRAIVPETLVFLDQSEYVRQLDGPRKTAMSDFRYLYRGDFRLIDRADNRETFQFILQAVKPSRWVQPGKGFSATERQELMTMLQGAREWS